MKKKLIAFGTAALLTISLAACSSDDKKDDGGQSETGVSQSTDEDTQVDEDINPDGDEEMSE
jgi:hypothetical protein